jgi:NADH dehydrogenase
VTDSRESTPRIVVLGGGAAGAAVASRLCAPGGPVRRGRCSVTVVDPSPAHVRAPLLPHLVAGSARALRHVATSVAAATGGAEIETGRFVDVDGDRRTVDVVDPLTDARRTIAWDHLVVALGSCNEDMTVPGVADHARTLRTPGDAFALRQQVVAQLTAAATTTDPDVRDELTTFVVVGAGPAGVAAAASLRHGIDTAVGVDPAVSRSARVVLVDRKPRLLPQRDPDESTWLATRVAAAGVEFLAASTVASVDATTVRFARDRGELSTRLCVWTAGVRAHPIVQATFDRCELSTGGRLVVNPLLQVRGIDDTWAIGDCASVPNLDAGGDCPALGSFAVAQAQRLALSLTAALDGEWPRSFRSTPRALLVSLGPGDAAGFVGRRRVHGRAAAEAWLAGVVPPTNGLRRLRRSAPADPFLTTDTSRPYAAPREGAAVVTLGRKPSS